MKVESEARRPILAVIPRDLEPSRLDFASQIDSPPNAI
jgi:hypothetical protein